ncbi:TonB-dependent siderophore receptor [Pseudorhodoferax sp. LjRoot39]|uniref:TonB-dependent siderophore receptor n=1 Tax=Pseudorhodoferax sp. LjRoot39 TaxID=3342328 RepID=UPI003ED04326
MPPFHRSVFPAARRLPLWLALRRRAPLAAAAALLALGAQAQTVALDLPAGPLEQSLNVLAQQAGVQVMFASGLAQGRSAGALRGSLTPREALDRLLAGSGLAVRTADGGKTFVVERGGTASTAPAAPVPGTGGALPAVQVVAGAERSATTEGSRDYTARAVTIGLGEHALRETPNSVSVLTRQRIEDQNFFSIEEAMQYTTALKVTTYGTNNFNLESRGYNIDRYQIDGVSSSARVYENNFSLAMFDRVEVWRGPAGLLQGAGDPGGTVNMVRKRAQDQFGFNAKTSVGSWDHYYADADVTGPLNADGSLRGRLVVAWQNRHYFTDYARTRQPMVYGTLEYDFDADTTLSLGHSQQRTTNRPFFGLAAYAAGGYPDVSRSTYIGALWNHQEQNSKRSFAELEHRLAGGGKLTLSANHVARDNAGEIAWGNSNVDPVTGDMLVVPYFSTTREREVNLQGQLSLPFQRQGLRQEIVLGANRQVFRNTAAYNSSTWGQNGFVQNVFAPDPDVAKPDVAIDAPYSRIRQIQNGLFGQARIKPVAPLTLVAGARVAWFEYQNLLDRATDRSENAKLVPYAGVVYDLGPEWSVYGSYSSIFSPQSETDRGGGFLQPRQGHQFEVGVKGEHFDKRVSSSLGLYRIEDSNRAMADPDPDFPDASVAAGKVRSQGLEAELTGRITPQWNLTAGYGYNSTRQLSAAPAQQGQPFTTVFPRHLFSLWSDHRFANGLSLAAGVRVRSGIYSEDSGVRWKAGGVAVFSAQAGYQITPQLRATLTLHNLLDRKYIDRPDGWTRQSYYGEPRSVMASLSYRY